jgi:hypothetical protein
VITRTHRASLSDYFRYFAGGNPRDTWDFEVSGHRFTLVNEWRNGAKLLVDGLVVDQNNKLIEVSGEAPFLCTNVYDTLGNSRKIEVFIRARVQVLARVHVDGKPINHEFI